MATSLSAAVTAATPDTRDRFVDFLRVLSIFAVIVGHWLLSMLTLYGAGQVSFQLPFELITWALQVMPLFFAGVLELAGWEKGPMELAADRITTPLWFIGVYLLVVLFAPLMEAWHRRSRWLALAALVAAAIALDLLRFRYGQEWAGIVNLLVVWLAVHQLGFFWADGVLTRRGVPLGCALGGFALTIWLTFGTGWYPVLMVGLPGNPTSNMAPPDLALLTLAFGMLGLALLVRGPVNAWLHRPRPWAAVVFGNSVVLTLFCWHLTAVFLLQGALLLVGVKPPPAGTGAWWAILPLWLAGCAVPLVGLVALFRRFEQPFPRTTGSAGPVGTVAAAIGVTATALGIFELSQVGYDGLFLGSTETVDSIPLAGWMGVAALGLGLLLLYVPRPAATAKAHVGKENPVAAHATVEGNSDNGAE